MAVAQPIAPAVRAGEMSLVDHLTELRRRLMVAIAMVAAGAAVGFWQHEAVFAWLIAPVKPHELMVTSPTEAFRATMMVSLYAGLVLAWPGLMHQAIGFAAPGLKPRERRAILPAILAATALFVAGAYMAYALLLPAGLHFLVGFAPTGVAPMLSLEQYMGFAAGLVVAGGVLCQLPVVLVAAAWLGLVTSAQLTRYRRYAVFGAFLTAAVASPAPDPVSQGLMAGLLIALYEGSVAVIRWSGR